MSIYRLEYCPTCKRTVTSNKGICKKCGNKVAFRGYGVRVSMINEEGREIHRALSPFATQKEAKQAEAEFRAENPLPRHIKSKSYEITLNTLFENYIAYQKSRLKETTVYEIKKIYEYNIAPFFGKLKLTSIDKRRILDWQAHLDSKGYTHSTKKKLRSKFHAILDYGVLYYDLPFNIIDRVPNFRNTEIKKEMQIWTPQEFNSFINLFGEDANDYVCRVFLTLLYMTGCRKGEALALNWGDINFETKILNINKNLSRRIDYNNYKITSPKNASSVRKIMLPDSLVELLKEYKEKFDGKFIFGGDSPLSENKLTKRIKKYSELADIPRIRIHDFRHSHASYLISQGVDIVSVAKRLGHSDIKQTLNTYAHLLDLKESDTLNALNLISI